jgi:di/tricarboxylate transporter
MDLSILIVLIILTATVVMLIFEIMRIDLVAILCMLSLGWTGILEPEEMLSGFSSSAVFAVISVMIMGRGIARTGVMDKFSGFVVRRAGNNRKKVVTWISLAAGAISGFVQNTGAVALFLPGVLDISRRTRIPASALVMPVGFAIILGGTLTMVGVSHLILANDLLVGSGLEPFGLFRVTPIGVLLLLTGIIYFRLFGSSLLPDKPEEEVVSSQQKMIENLQLPGNIRYYAIGPDSPLAGKTTEGSGIWRLYNINIIGIAGEEGVIYAPWRETTFESGQQLALLGSQENIERFAREFSLIAESVPVRFERLRNPYESGFAEVIVPPSSTATGNTVREFSMRRRFAVEPLRLFSRGEEMRGDFSDHKFSPGDTIIVYGLWEKIQEMKQSIDFVVATPVNQPDRDTNSRKTVTAALSFILAISLALAGFPIAISFFTGAIIMVLSRVMNMQQAYESIDWKIIFLLAGMIPLGIAMQKTGAALWLAETVMKPVTGDNMLILMLLTGVLSTLLSLFISNIGAIVVLAPMVTAMASIAGVDPRILVLLSAICASNSFILPTQQVNAMLMGSAGYRSADFIRAGSGLTLLFLVVTVTLFWLGYTFNVF